MKNLLIFSIILILFTSCNKETDGNLSGDKIMIGRLMLSDPLIQGATIVSLPQKKVVIRESQSTDLSNYMFSTTTDAQGYFRFDNLKESVEYTVAYEEVVDGILYQSDYNHQKPTNELAVIARIATNKQNGMVFQATDEFGNILKEAEICIFTNSNSPGYVKSSCDGSSYQLKTDANGKTKLFGIGAGSYYVLANKTIGGLVYTEKQLVTLANEVKQVVIKVVKPATKNGISFSVTDNSGNLMKEADLCVFKSNTSLGYLNGNCDGSSYQYKTDANGEAKMTDIPAGTYYVLVSKMVGGVPMTAKTTVVVGTDPVTVNVKISSGNGIRFSSTDVNGDAIGNVTLCVFTSKLLFDRDTCDGNSFQLATESNGLIIKYAMEKTTYYVYATKTIGTEVWVAKQTVVVGDAVATCDLKLVKK
jgi:hypothetical protein